MQIKFSITKFFTKIWFTRALQQVWRVT